MKGLIKGNYYSANRTLMFTYHVLGTAQELAKFKEVQDNAGIQARGTTYYAVDENPLSQDGVTPNPHVGKPIFNSPRDLGDNPTLIVTQNGRVVADNMEQARAEQREMDSMIRAEEAKLIAQDRHRARSMRGSNAFNRTAGAAPETPKDLGVKPENVTASSTVGTPKIGA